MTPSNATKNCSICMKVIDFQGGKPICSLGCCSNFFHQCCIDDLKSTGNSSCPVCKNQFLNPPPSQLQQQQQQQAISQKSRFNISSIFGLSSISLELEDPVDPHNQVSNDSTNDITNHSSVVSITSTPEYPQVSIEGKPNFYVRVSLKYEDNEILSNKKSPIDIVCVLDVSGSMTGTKIKSLIHAMCFVVDSLGPKDRLSIVSFESQSKMIHSLLKMTSTNKSTSKQRIQSLVAGGGTDIYAGIQQGYNILEARSTKNPTSCVFLLTDGQDRERTKEKLELASRMKRNGTSLFVFGFGNDHDSAHMSDIANAAEGNFTFIESDTMVIDAFGGVIGTLQGVSLQNISLQLQLTEHNIIIKEVIAGKYNATISNDGRSGNLFFINMFIGESRDVLLKLDLPSVTNAIDDYELFKTWATFGISGVVKHNTVQTTTSSTSNCCINRIDVKPDDPLLSMHRNVEVGIQLSRRACINAINEALIQADQGKLEESIHILKEALANLKTVYSHTLEHIASKAIEQDLHDALSQVQSRDSYRSGGRAMMQEATSNHSYQRSCYKKTGKINAYQTTSSNNVQQKAFATKGGGFI